MALVLVVDDERLICDLLQAALNRHGYTVLTASRGPKALELFRHHRPQITLLDLRMPEMDGIAVLTQIRAIDPQAAVIVLTSEERNELENRARELGVADFLKKGLSLDVIIKALERVIQQQVRTQSVAASSEKALSGSQNRESILVVDDESLIRSLLSDFLIRRGFRVRAAQNGPEALTLVEQEQPRLIILDLNMPGMNGVELLRELRKRNYPGGVITLTASQDEQLLEQTLELGSVDVMGKPVDLERLALVVEVALILAA
jgi:CheY-like chemotaxis protein